MDKMFFDSWEGMLRVFIITVLAYVLVIILLRVSGKRTLSKMNAFDFIITIALGSLLAALILDKNVPLAEGILGFFLLIYLQYFITYLSVRSKRVNKLVKSSPALMVYKGEMLEAAMVRERISADEIFAVIRENGYNSISDVDAVILETDGSLTLVKRVTDFNNETMQPVKQ